MAFKQPGLGGSFPEEGTGGSGQEGLVLMAVSEPLLALIQSIHGGCGAG